MTAYTLMNRHGTLVGATSDEALARNASDALDLRLIKWVDLGPELMASIEYIKMGYKHWLVELGVRTGEPLSRSVPAVICRCGSPWTSPMEYAKIVTGETFVTHVWAKHELTAVDVAKKVRLKYLNMELYGE